MTVIDQWMKDAFSLQWNEERGTLAILEDLDGSYKRVAEIYPLTMDEIDTRLKPIFSQLVARIALLEEQVKELQTPAEIPADEPNEEEEDV